MMFIRSVVNSIEQSINFTYEKEQNGKLPSLNVSVRSCSSADTEACIDRKPVTDALFSLLLASPHAAEMQCRTNTVAPI